ncbi:hypothetical protein N9544_06605 [Flavobacteriales bacterium]|nr:hypothetical protein [Flavobacteriales bacterium]
MSNFLKHTSTINYTLDSIEETKPTQTSDVMFNNNITKSWINTYGINFLEEFNQVVSQNNLDDFLRILIKENKHRNKTIELEDAIFLAINTIHLKNKEVTTEQMMFIVGKSFVWSIQEKKRRLF